MSKPSLHPPSLRERNPQFNLRPRSLPPRPPPHAYANRFGAWGIDRRCHGGFAIWSQFSLINFQFPLRPPPPPGLQLVPIRRWIWGFVNIRAAEFLLCGWLWVTPSDFKTSANWSKFTPSRLFAQAPPVGSCFCPGGGWLSHWAATASE